MIDDGIEVGQRVGDLRVERELGKGAFGRVYLAQDTLIGRRVALKVVPVPGGAENEEQRLLALREARAVGRLNSPNIVTLYRVHPPVERNAWIFEMEYVEGGSLHDLLKEDERLPPLRALEIARGIASALATAHENGVIHGDVKPSNVLLRPGGGVKMADFGLARIRGDLSMSLSSTAGQLAGTPTFMSPEVIMGERPTAASDLWGLGVILYRLLAGRLPFLASNLNALFFAIQNANPPPLDETVPLELAELVQHCLAKPPADRPSSAASVLQRLEGSWQGRLTAQPAPPPTATRPSRLIGRDRETAQLMELVSRAERGEGAVALITGEAGMGKSALAQAALGAARARGFRCIEAAVTPLEGLLRALLEVSRSLIEMEEAPAPDTVLLGSAADVVRKLLDEEAGLRLEERAQSVWALEQLLRGFAKTQQLAILIEDAGNANAEDLRLLKHLIRYLPTAGVLLLVTGQPRAVEGAERLGPELASLPGVTIVDVGPLERETAYRILEERTGGARIAPEVADRILSVAQGNPLYVIELLRHLEESGAVERRNGRIVPGAFWSRMTLPRRFHELVAHRLEGLAEGDRYLLDVAAVDGLAFDGEAIAAVTGQPLLHVLRSLQRIYRERGIIVPAAKGFRFTNAVVQEAVYEDLAPELRRQIHHRLAEHLEERGGGDAVRIGLHWERAGVPHRAAPHLRAGAFAAAQRQEYLRAFDLASRGGLDPQHLDAAQAAADRELLLVLAVVSGTVGRADVGDRILDALAAAAEREDDDELRLVVTVTRSFAHYWSEGTPGIDEEGLRRAAEELPPSLHQARARYLLGMVAKHGGDLDAAERWMARADEVCRELSIASLRASVLDQRASVALRMNRPKEAERLYEESIRVSRSSGRRTNAAASEVNLALVAFGRGETAIGPVLERAIRAFAIEGAGNMQGHATGLLARVRYATGRTEEAVRLLDESLEILTRTGHLTGLLDCLTERAHMAAIQGEIDRAEEWMRAAREGAAKRQDASGFVSLALLETHVACFTGDLGAAEKAARDALERARAGQDAARVAVWLAEASVWGLPPYLAGLAEPPLGDELPEEEGAVRLGRRMLAARANPAAMAQVLADPGVGDRLAYLRLLGASLEAEHLEGEGRTREADDVARRALEAARPLGHVWLRARLLRQLGRRDDACGRELTSLLKGIGHHLEDDRAGRLFAAWRSE